MIPQQAIHSIKSKAEPMRMSSRLTLAGCAALGAGLAACMNGHLTAPEHQPMTADQPRIELLGFPDCPNTPMLRENLRAALASVEKEWVLIDTDQERLPEGDPRRGWPSPTVLVNGHDLFGMPAPSGTAMGCRMYPGGVPNTAELEHRLRDALKPG